MAGQPGRFPKYLVNNLSTKKIVAIVQARMGSSRLPGKVLREILPGKPLLSSMLERLEQSKLLTEIVVATTTNTIDDSIAQLCSQSGTKVFRGDENDVLGRYAAAAQEFTADIIVRLCADSPLHDAEIIDKCLAVYLQNQQSIDFVCNIMPNTFPYGTAVEVFPQDVLNRINRLAVTSSHREHVTQYIHHNPSLFRIINVENNENLSHCRWAVDCQDDLDFVEDVYAHLYEVGHHFSWHEVVSFARAS